MDIALTIIGFLLILTGIIGCIIPIIPGPPISYVGLLLFHFTNYVNLSTFTLIFIAILVLIATVLDYIIPIFGTKIAGGSKWGMRGSAIGLIIGLFFGVIGIFLFPFIGSFIGELLYQYYLNKNNSNNIIISLKSAFGSFIGLMLGIALKLAISCFIAFIYIKELIIAFY